MIGLERNGLADRQRIIIRISLWRKKDFSQTSRFTKWLRRKGKFWI